MLIIYKLHSFEQVVIIVILKLKAIHYRSGFNVDCNINI